MAETSSSKTVLTKQLRIAQLAVEAPDMAFTTLAHHIDLDWLHEAYRRTRKDGAVGVDGQTAEEYAVNLERNLRSLLGRAKSGSYYAPPVRRVHIPKPEGQLGGEAQDGQGAVHASTANHDGMVPQEPASAS